VPADNLPLSHFSLYSSIIDFGRGVDLSILPSTPRRAFGLVLPLRGEVYGKNGLWEIVFEAKKEKRRFL